MALKRIKERQERRKKVVMSIILSALMILSLAGIYLSSSSAQGSFKEFGVRFSVVPGSNGVNLYEGKVGGVKRSFYFLPSALLGIDYPSEANDVLRSSEALIVSFDPNSSVDSKQYIDLVRFDLFNNLDKPVISAQESDSGEYFLPVVGCDNASASLPVVLFREDDNLSVSFDNNCLVMQGKGGDFLALRDKFLYEYYGIYDHK